MASWFTDVPDTKYDYLWSSRKVVKNQYYNKEASAGYYGCDIWGEAHSKLSPYLTKGLTLYYEIIGWLPTGQAIQAMNGKDKGLIPVEQLYYGYAKKLYPELDETEHWNENFIQKLANDKRFHMEELSPTCHNDVPHEGIIIRIENGLSEAYKLKCFRFLGEESKSLDKGEIDIEADQ